MVEERELTFMEKVELQRDIDYWKRKFRMNQELFLKNLQDNELSSYYAEQLANIDKTLSELKKQGGNYSIRNLRYAIYECMQLKNWSHEFTAQKAGVTVEVVKECLSGCGFLRSSEHTHFGMWAIQTFELDANAYIQYFKG